MNITLAQYICLCMTYSSVPWVVVTLRLAIAGRGILHEAMRTLFDSGRCRIHQGQMIKFNKRFCLFKTFNIDFMKSNRNAYRQYIVNETCSVETIKKSAKF